MAAIGIDFGTCNSCVGVFQQGKVEIIANDQGKKTIPSYVAFTDTECLVGEAAKNQVEKNPENTIYDIKRLLGRKFDDPHIQKDMKHWPFKVINDNGKPKVEVHFKGETKSFYPEEIAAIILRKMKETAEAYLGKTVTDAVISVPGYSNNAQREATRDAAAIAGLNTLVLINEPIAAAVAYKLQQNGGGQKPVLIFAVGGGFSDVSVMSVFDDIYQVKLTAGDAHLGGEDFDNKMVNHFLEEFLKEHNKDPSEDKHAMQRLRIACEEAKKTLSSNDEASIELDSFFEGINFHTNITRATFEELNLENFSRLFYQIEEILSVSIIGSQIENVVLVGGSTRIPKLQIVVQDYFQAREINKSLNPDEAVAYGAAIKAATLSDVDGVPCVFNADVVPISIGLEITDETIIKKNTPFPATSTTVFSTQSENQASLPVKVFEGKRDTPKGVNTLGTYKLSEIAPAPQGVPVLEVTFEVDESGILNVFAEDQSGGKTKELTVTKDEAFSKEEIEKMAKEVEALFKEH